jgi:hypothetical protein
MTKNTITQIEEWKRRALVTLFTGDIVSEPKSEPVAVPPPKPTVAGFFKNIFVRDRQS